IERFVVHRKDQYRDTDRKRLYAFDKLQPAGPFQSDVYYRQIRGCVSNKVDRLLSIFGFSTYLHIQLMINQLRETFTKQRMVVDDNDPFFFFTHDLLNRSLEISPAVSARRDDSRSRSRFNMAAVKPIAARYWHTPSWRSRPIRCCSRSLILMISRSNCSDLSSNPMRSRMESRCCLKIEAANITRQKNISLTIASQILSHSDEYA